MTTHILVNAPITSSIPGTRTFAVAFETEYILDAENYQHVMSIEDFVTTNRDDPMFKWAIVELFNSSSLKHSGNGSEENLSGVLLQAFDTPVSTQPITRNILVNATPYYVYIVTFQGPTGVNQTTKVIKQV